MRPLHNSKHLAKVQEAVARGPLSDEDLEGLEDTIKKGFQWSHSPRSFQLEAIRAQLQCKDVVVHAGTGSGKTVIAAGPHTHPRLKGRVTLMVSPLIGLQDEQAGTFQDEFKLKAMSINSAHGGLTEENMLAVCQGAHQIIVISPELLLSDVFIDRVIHDDEFAIRIFALVIDEAHVIAYWGPLFRKKYAELGNLRALLPKETPFVVLSATLPPGVRAEVLKTLRFSEDESDYVNINIGNDRPNVSLVSRAIEHPMNSYADLDFVIPAGVSSHHKIPKTFIYVDNVAAAVDVESHIEELLPESLRGKGLIRPYNAAFTQEYRAAAMLAFKQGEEIRVLICTDACGMGCNIPDIEVVVQWKLPGSISMMIQRFGRAARAAGTVGLSVLLAEKTAYEVDLDKAFQPTGQGKRRKPPARPKATRSEKSSAKKYAAIHGVNRGSYAKTDAIVLTIQPRLDPMAADEGLLVFVQTGCCRRSVCTQVFNNEPAKSTVDCCDVCCPKLLNRTRPGKFTKSRESNIKQGQPCKEVQIKVIGWRTKIYKRDYSGSMIGPSAILSDELVEVLSSVGPIGTEERLSRLISGRWLLYGTYCNELFEFLRNLQIPAMIPKERKPRGVKRKQTHTEDGSSTNDADSADPKRPNKPNEKVTRKMIAAHKPASATSTQPVVAASELLVRSNTPSTSQSVGEAGAVLGQTRITGVVANCNRLGGLQSDRSDCNPDCNTGRRLKLAGGIAIRIESAAISASDCNLNALIAISAC